MSGAEVSSVERPSTLLAGRVVVVCGVGPGLGRALALRCADHGASVVLVARSPDRLDDVVAEITSCGGTALGVRADASVPDDAARVVRTTVETFGMIDGLVNNAAVIPALTPAADLDRAAMQASLEANFSTAHELTRAVLPIMRQQGVGSVVMVASAVVQHPKVGFGAYNVAKHAMVGLARSLALELGPEGVRVNVLAPGKIAGERLENYFAARAEGAGVPADEIREQYVANIALRRLPDPFEYADAAVFLLSDMSRAITGHLLGANGGEYFI